MGNDGSSALREVWQAKQQRLEEELLKLRTSPLVDQEWQKHVSLLDRRLRSFVSSSARASRLSLLSKWRLRAGSLQASKGLIDIFLREIQVAALFASPDLRKDQAYRVPASRYYPAEVVDLPDDALLPPVLPGSPVIEVTSGQSSFYVGAVVNPKTGTSFSRGYGYWYQDAQQRRFESADLIPESLAKRFPTILPLLTQTEELLKGILKAKGSREHKANVENQLASLCDREKAWSRIHIPTEQIIELLRNAELFERKDPAAPKGLLLAGVPGTGKSLIARTLAETTGCSFHSASLADLKSSHIGGTAQNVRELWAKARSNEPAIIFLDECEGIFARRGGSETDIFAQDLIQSFLAEWDGVRGPSLVWVIGATNRRDLLDDAILSRFGWELDVRLPDAAARSAIFRQEMEALGFTGPIPAELADLTQGMSGRDLSGFAKRVRANTTPRTPLNEDFLKTLETLRQRTRPNVSSAATWANLVLDVETKSMLQTTCDLLRHAEAWEARGVSVPRGILLTGPPGVGKTQVARTMAFESGLAFVTASTADIKAKWVGHSGSQVKQLFEKARSNAPAIVFLDEVDIVAKRRGSGSNDQHQEEIVGQLLQELDGLRAHQGHVFLLAATNHPEDVDAALLSRLPQRISLPLPDRASCVQMLGILLQEKPISHPLREACELLAQQCASMNWSGRDLRSWVERAEQRAVQRAVLEGGPNHYELRLSDFERPVDNSIR